MMDVRYPAKVSEDPAGGFCVQFIDLNEAFTEGDTLEEALFNAAEVLTLTLEGRLSEGMDVPDPSQGVKGGHYIAPDAKTQGVLLLRAARGDRTLAQLARAMDTSWPQAKRLEDPRHWPSLKTLDKAARVLGKRLVLSIE
ncbi:type II toxin-antitoxin system HicB family antitoxin [Pusillimonas sp. MFBS29]|uniref:type II toxin-antitoxin system HicB family antitoxin n=1 Tax=Pusillimonas sp. MFBS29 TaxID=2886690 RepID=UPI001D11E822|nr:type II toxin-antitoxin system HicB family antitoxin [Pusillimonas sp. MFBS29]MCC2596178.1 type II toxin-antitoxin system HicB family antitoxin [Pusillimonas sp. MFBS29]